MKKLLLALALSFSFSAQANENCAKGAMFVQAAGNARDSGVSQEDFNAQVDELMGEDATFDQIVDIVYVNYEKSPSQLAREFYSWCVNRGDPV